jgi:CspA family cold shock protein
MTKGVVKWYNKEKGYGFVRPDGGDKDIFVHASAVDNSGYKFLSSNDEISFDIDKFNGKDVATNIRKI